MTTKLQNKSNNLEEILAAVVAGKAVQYKSCANLWIVNKCDSDVLHFLDVEWRVKPDAFEEVYHKWLDDSSGQVILNVNMARHFWNAATEHKNDN